MAKVKRSWLKVISFLGAMASFFTIGLMGSSATKADPTQANNSKKFVEVRKEPDIKYPKGPAPVAGFTCWSRPQETKDVVEEMNSKEIDLQGAQIIMQEATLEKIEALEQKLDEILKKLEAQSQNK